MMNKINIVELVQLYNVDQLFDQVKFLYKLDCTKNNAEVRFTKKKFILTSNSSESFFDELNKRFLVSKTVEEYLCKRLFFRTIVGRTDKRLSVVLLFRIGSTYPTKSLKNKFILFSFFLLVEG